MRVKTFVPLSDDFKPPKLLHRDKQLRDMLKLIVERDVPENLWLEGGKGLGKTLTCKCFADEVEARGAGKVIFMQCERSMKRAMESVCSCYGLPIPAREASPSSIASAVSKEYRNVGVLVFIIEEPENASSLLNVCSFTHTLYNVLLETCGKSRFSICFTSRLLFSVAEREFEGEKDSRLGLRPIIFNQYDAQQITDILRQRLDLMFEASADAYDEEALYLIARHVWRVGSDIREALKITRMAVELAENKITREVAEEAIERSKREWWLNQILQLPPHQAFLLYLAAEEACSNAGFTALQANVVDKYIRRTESMGVDRLDRRTVYYMLSDLAKKGFYGTEQIHAFGKPLKLTFDKRDAERIIEACKNINWDKMLR